MKTFLYFTLSFFAFFSGCGILDALKDSELSVSVLYPSDGELLKNSADSITIKYSAEFYTKSKNVILSVVSSNGLLESSKEIATVNPDTKSGTISFDFSNMITFSSFDSNKNAMRYILRIDADLDGDDEADVESNNFTVYASRSY